MLLCASVLKTAQRGIGAADEVVVVYIQFGDNCYIDKLTALTKKTMCLSLRAVRETLNVSNHILLNEMVLAIQLALDNNNKWNNNT